MAQPHHLGDLTLVVFLQRAVAVLGQMALLPDGQRALIGLRTGSVSSMPPHMSLCTTALLLDTQEVCRSDVYLRLLGKRVANPTMVDADII